MKSILSVIMAFALTGQVFAKGSLKSLEKTSHFKGSALRRFIYPEDLGRDPFEALINSQGVINIGLVRQEKDLILNGIIYDNDESKRLAVINNTVLKTGDYIGSYRIKKIMPSGVLLIKKGKEITIKIGGGNER